MPAIHAISPERDSAPAAVAPGFPRFTLDGSRELEAQLEDICEAVLASVRHVIPERRLEALILGGGYGRGEGGVFRSATGERPYNDLEFYVCVRGNRFLNRRRYGRELNERAEELSSHAGIEIEFKIISLAHLSDAPPAMFYYDLVMGHRWLWGEEKLLADCEHHRDAALIPMSEAARLLMNRCTGLLLARERLGREPFTPAHSDFVQRNLAKAELALGDALLTAVGQYHWSCRERVERLLKLPLEDERGWLAEVRRCHLHGAQFKLHPQVKEESIKELRWRHQELTALAARVWLWLENRRLGRAFQSAHEYALSETDKCPGTKPWRNRLINLSVFGPVALFLARSRRHPRERIFNALAMLLWEQTASEGERKRWLAEELGMPGGDPLDHAHLLAGYEGLWRRVR